MIMRVVAPRCALLVVGGALPQPSVISAVARCFLQPLQYEVRPETSVPQKVQTHFPTTWRPTFLSVPWNLSASNYSASEKPTYERSAVPKVLSSPVPLSSCLFLHHGACGLDGLETS